MGCVGRVGALAVATRMTVSIGVAALAVAATVMPAPTVSPEVRLSASSPPCTKTDVTCALIMGTSGVPTPDDFYVESVKNQFIAPTHPGQIDYVDGGRPGKPTPSRNRRDTRVSEPRVGFTVNANGPSWMRRSQAYWDGRCR